jgi:hypothetical protein
MSYQPQAAMARHPGSKDDEEYELPFNLNWDFDWKHSPWEKKRVGCCVKPGDGNNSLLPIKEVVAITLDKRGEKALNIRRLPKEEIKDNYVFFEVSATEKARDYLKFGFEVTVKVRVDPKGGGKAIVTGRKRIRLAVPPPFIHVGDLKSPGLKELIVDTSEVDGTAFDIHLLQYSHASKKYEESGKERGELLRFETRKQYAENPFKFIPDGPTRFRLKPRQVIIGSRTPSGKTLETNGIGEIAISRESTNRPQAANAPLKINVNYKACDHATLDVKVLFPHNGEEVLLNPGDEKVEVNGERVKLLFPRLPPKLKAMIRWKVTDPEREHEREGDFHFQTEEKETILKPDQHNGQDCLGAVIDIIAGKNGSVKDPLTVADECVINTLEPDIRLRLIPDPDKAYADGTFKVNITPKLFIFGKEYREGVKFRSPQRNVPYTPYDDTFFKQVGLTELQPLPQVSNVELWRGNQRSDHFFGMTHIEGDEILHLRCKFHFEDRAIKNLFTDKAGISLKAYPTGVLAEMFPDGLLPIVEAEVSLRTSKVRLTTDAPPGGLPRSVKEPDPLFETKVSAKILSGDDRLVPGHVITDDQTLASVKLYLKQYGWKINGTLSAKGSSSSLGGFPPFQIEIANVDAAGRVEFEKTELMKGKKKWLWTPDNEVSSCVYHHLNYCWDDAAEELKAENCDLKLSFEADGDEVESTVVSIGEQVKSVHISWDYSPFHLNNTLTHENDGGFGGVSFMNHLMSLGYKVKKNLLCENCIKYLNVDPVLDKNGDPKYKGPAGGCQQCADKNAPTIYVFLPGATHTVSVVYQGDGLGKYTEVEWDTTNDAWVEVQKAGRDLFGMLKPRTVLVGGWSGGNGGHSGIIVEEQGSQKIKHFMMATGKGPSQMGKWFNRDQIKEMLSDEGQKDMPGNFERHFAYVDTVDEWLIRNGPRQYYKTIHLLEPPYVGDVRRKGPMANMA